MRYCWQCYGKQPPESDSSAPCPRCGQSPQEPPGTGYSDRLLWALSHPLVERRIIAAGALADRGEPRAIAPLQDMAHDDDPYLAAAAVRALAQYPPEISEPTLRDVAARGPAPARRAAEQALQGGDASS